MDSAPFGPKGGEALFSERYISAHMACQVVNHFAVHREPRPPRPLLLLTGWLRLPELETICPLPRAGEAPETALSGSILEKKRQTRNRGLRG